MVALFGTANSGVAATMRHIHAHSISVVFAPALAGGSGSAQGEAAPAPIDDDAVSAAIERAGHSIELFRISARLLFGHLLKQRPVRQWRPRPRHLCNRQGLII